MKIRLPLKILRVLIQKKKSPSFPSSPLPKCFILHLLNIHVCLSTITIPLFFPKEAYIGKQNQGRTKCHKMQNVMLFVFGGNYGNSCLPT